MKKIEKENKLDMFLLILIEKSKEHKNISQYFKLPGLDHNEYSSCSCESILLFAINLIHITTL